jgi:predicted dehydrogenase
VDFALLGIDAASLALVQAALRQGHHLVWAHDLAGREAEVRALAPEATLAPHWEGVLGGSIAQAVIVAPRDDDERAEQLRKLAAERVPLLVCHPVHSSTLLHLELDMIRRDAGGVIVPYIASRWHPAVAHVRELLAGGKLGALEQIVCERSMPTRTRAAVLRCFMEDAPLVRQFLGEVTKVGAMASTPGEAGFANLGVQLTGPSGVLARWSVAPVADQAGAVLSIVGSRGKVTLRMPEAGGASESADAHVWHVEESPGGAPPSRFDGTGGPALAIDALEQALSGPTPPDDWGDAVRAAQLTEAVERSLRRGRVISLEFDEHTEEGTFKGVMATLGCGLLLLAPIVSLLPAAIIHGLGWRKFGDAWLQTLGVVFGVFLLLQFFLLLIPKKAEG